MKEYKYDLLCVGTALVDSIIKGFDPTPISASGFRAQSGSLNVGGEAVNEAVTAAKLGLKTGILCSLGNDAAGNMVRTALENNGVCTEDVAVSCEHPTPVSTLLVNADGTRKSITNEAHRYNFHPEQYKAALSSARAITLGSMFRAPFNEIDVIKDTFDKADGAIIFADTKLPNFNKLSLDDIKDILPRVDYIFPNEDEARYYSGKTDPDEMADVFLSYGIKNVIIKLGAEGCLLKNKDERIRLKSLEVNAVDATGAGDNFLAGFAYEILNGSDNETALRFANACGALCTTEVGAVTALKNAEQVRMMLV